MSIELYMARPLSTYLTKERMIERRFITPEGCWIIPGSKSYFHHRRAWVLWNGPIAPKMMVCHKCDNPICFNVEEHLFLGTNSDNVQDMIMKGRSNFSPIPQPSYKQRARGEHNGGWKRYGPEHRVTSEQVLKIYQDTRSQRTIAKSYGISQALVSHIKCGRLWRHVTNHQMNQ
jgi:hypothetical protein